MDYKLDIGNSTHGQIGLCAYTEANSPEEALAHFRNTLLGEAVEIRHGRYYQVVYLNWDKISLDDIEEWDEAEESKRVQSSSNAGARQAVPAEPELPPPGEAVRGRAQS